MKQKLKYLLIIGITLTIPNGATQIVANSQHRETPSTYQESEHLSALSTAATSTNNTSSHQELLKKIDRRINKIIEKLSNLIAQHNGTIAPGYESLLNGPLSLSTNIQNSTTTEIARLTDEKMRLLDFANRLINRAFSEDKRTGFENLPQKNTFTVVDTTNSKVSKTPRTLESLIAEAQQNSLLKVTRKDASTQTGVCPKFCGNSKKGIKFYPQI